MIDPQILRENPDLLRASLRTRGANEGLVDTALAADQARRDAITAFEALRAEQNVIGKDVAKASGAEKEALLASVKKLSDAVKDASAKVTEAEEAAATTMHDACDLAAYRRRR